MTDTEFENRISEYIQGELPSDEQVDMDAYLQVHPEAQEQIEQMREVLTLTASIHEAPLPEGLFESARVDTLAQIEKLEQSAPQSAQRTWLSWLPTFRYPRLTYGFSFAAAILIALLVASPSTDPKILALEGIMGSLKDIQSFRTEGWIRNENGDQLPFRMWLQSMEVFRTEIGTGEQQRVVISDESRRIIQDRNDALFESEMPDGQRDYTLWTVSFLSSFYRDMHYRSQNQRNHVDHVDQMDKGQSVLFTIHYEFPIKHTLEIEVNKETRRPIKSRVYEPGNIGSEMVSELNYYDYNTKFSSNLFKMPSSKALPTAENRADLWYERSITPAFTLYPARTVPEQGIRIKPLDLLKNRSGKISSANTTGGIKEHRFYGFSIPDIVRQLSNTTIKVEDESLAQGREWIGLEFKDILSNQDKIDALCRTFGLEAVWETRSVQRTRFIVVQDGRRIPGHFLMAADDDTPIMSGISGGIGSELRSRHQGPLTSVVHNILTTVESDGYDASIDTIEYRWDGESGPSPLEQFIKIDFEPSRAWSVNMQFLSDSLGVHVERILEPVTRPIITLRRAANPDTEQIGAREQRFGGNLLAPIDNPEQTKIELPFVLHRDAEVRISIWDYNLDRLRERISLLDIISAYMGWGRRDMESLFTMRRFDLGQMKAGRYTSSQGVVWDKLDKDRYPLPTGEYTAVLEIDGRPVHGRNITINR